MTTYFFPHCRLNVSDSGQTTAYFPTGYILEHLPRPNEDKTTARWLGYGSDTRRFRREHDVLVHTLTMLQGLDHSPQLHAEGYVTVVPGGELSENNEAVDLLCERVHRWLNLDIWTEDIRTVLHCGLNRDELRDFLRAVLEGEITQVDNSSAAQHCYLCA